MKMKKTYFSLSLLTSVALLACGRPSTSNYFDLDGVGDPNNPVAGNPLPGTWGGNIELSNWDILYPDFVAGLFGVALDSTLQINQAYFNETDISGLGGWHLTVINVPQPRRLALGQFANCFMDPETLPLLGGDLVSADVGEDIEIDIDGNDFRARVSDYEDSLPDDLLIYFGDIQDQQTGDFLLNPYDQDVDLEWEGGTLPGFEHAPPLGRTEILRYPDELVLDDGATIGHPTVNNVRLGDELLIEPDTEYEIEWTESTVNQDLRGVQIVVTVYGPANLGTPEQYDVLADNPYFNRLARIVCLVDDELEQFTIFQSAVNQAMVDAGEASPFTIDDVVELAMSSGKFDSSTEDTNGNGVLDPPYACGTPLSPSECVEDGNRNGLIDQLYGIALTVNRRSEREVELDLGPGHRNADILVSGNSIKQGKFRYLAPPFQCGNGLDDDGDGDIDNQDAGCANEDDNLELTDCDNGLDDDSDGLIDFPDDPQCASADDDDEEI